MEPTDDPAHRPHPASRRAATNFDALFPALVLGPEAVRRELSFSLRSASTPPVPPSTWPAVHASTGTAEA
ncbi:hypothetical protein [Amycolatopsis sp. AA4]|uniref:hypothetical protein n=1 Tax=Amycolatopsis sp. AA4 TaxID=1896961 RepID=UPI0013312F55|nr:hypothetical protein [Amycolatopsis sp. AA4]